MAQFNSKNQSSRVARRWFTDFDTNMTLHPQSGDLTLKYDINYSSKTKSCNALDFIFIHIP